MITPCSWRNTVPSRPTLKWSSTVDAKLSVLEQCMHAQQAASNWYKACDAHRYTTKHSVQVHCTFYDRVPDSNEVQCRLLERCTCKPLLNAPSMRLWPILIAGSDRFHWLNDSCKVLSEISVKPSVSSSNSSLRLLRVPSEIPMQ